MIARKRQGVTSAMSVKVGHGGVGGGGGCRTGGGGGGHESDRAAADVLEMEGFFGVVIFDGPPVSLQSIINGSNSDIAQGPLREKRHFSSGKARRSALTTV